MEPRPAIPAPPADRQCDWYHADQTRCPNPAIQTEPEFGMDTYCDEHVAAATDPDPRISRRD